MQQKRYSNELQQRTINSKQWQPISAKDSDGPIVVDDCKKDDLMTFALTGIFTYSPGVTKCDRTETIQTGSWTISSDEKNITMTAKDGSEVYTIVEITANKLIVSSGSGINAWEETYIAH